MLIKTQKIIRNRRGKERSESKILSSSTPLEKAESILKSMATGRKLKASSCKFWRSSAFLIFSARLCDLLKFNLNLRKGVSTEGF